MVPAVVMLMLLVLNTSGAHSDGRFRHSALSDDPVAHWPRAFSSEFNETTKLLRWSWETEGAMFYDVEQQAELVYRANGRGDRYCGSIHPATDTPCVHLVVGGTRYLFWPELRQCCACCSAAAGCGILDPHWLDGAEYIGQVTVQGLMANEWAIRGLQPNQYYATADAREVPLQLDQQPNAFISFHPASFKAGRVPPSVFSLPADVQGGCSKRCPLLSTCTVAALRGALAGSRALGPSRGAAVWQQPWRRRGGGSAAAAAAAASAAALTPPQAVEVA